MQSLRLQVLTVRHSCYLTDLSAASVGEAGGGAAAGELEVDGVAVGGYGEGGVKGRSAIVCLTASSNSRVIILPALLPVALVRADQRRLPRPSGLGRCMIQFRTWVIRDNNFCRCVASRFSLPN